MSTLSVTVASRITEAQDICRLELVAADGSALPSFEAGAHIDVHVGDGLVRQYSLCNEPSERHRYVIAVLKDPASRGGSVAVHGRVQPGDRLAISAPRNHFALMPAPQYLLLAGGIGITPILAMAEQLHLAGGAFELHYCTRSPERTAFLERVTTAAWSHRAQLHFDSDPVSARLDIPAVLARAPAGTRLYVCGPAGFIDHVLDTARASGWPEERLHREFFAAPAPSGTAEQRFRIRLHRSGKEMDVPADQSVTEVLAAHGVEVPTSCESGVCGTCLTRVIDGTPDHRDVYLTDAEHERNDQFTPCCSRSSSPLLVLDL
ncbi:PDR/VanB family oxidoreductase [Azohydromonas australica]|jgi:vanillate O-demethylase ferredoxin subunit|uniref:PDR/VanB family oxidoreductase n=1 Tax=Azohydromonas australica TaxID=364039 RepID=UPI000422EAF5|nr:PDR/VanB family oxidoreductase [Azohydromonas australica]